MQPEPTEPIEEERSMFKSHHSDVRPPSRVHEWRAAQLRRLGVSDTLADIYADHVDWHQIARLVQRGCPPRLALRILR
jgi:predicted component of type VI protein secretion system